MSNKLKLFIIANFLLFIFSSNLYSQKKLNLLIFSKTAGYRHESIETGIKAITKLGMEKNFTVTATEDSEFFTEQNLKNYNAVIFLNTTGDILNLQQQSAFERYIQAGGGYVGIHAASDTEYEWPWYNKLVGAYFLDHPSTPSNVQNGRFYVVKRNELTEGLPDEFERKDEFYSFKDFNKNVNVILNIDEKSYIGGSNGDNHPISWYHEFDGGRAFYTGMGHTPETFSEPLFLKHLYAGINYVTGGKQTNVIDFSKSRPEENRFTKVVLESNLDEPMELTILDNERILFIQRKGEVRLYNLKTKKLKTIAKIPVSTVYKNEKGEESTAEDGLMGLNKDPMFAKNNWIYMYYSSTKGSYNVLSRFTMKGDEILLNSEKEILKVDVQRLECCHAGGSIEWDKDGNLYLSTGDNTNPFASDGYSPSDERPGRSPWDAQKSSANTNDLRGKILRIKPNDDGTYSIPKGNLFPEGTPNTRPEIYTMGHRNPFRISVDKKTGYVYWGDVGPDANEPREGRGPAGHDEIGQAKEPGNFGWPYFVGNNKAYNKYDFAKNETLEKWDPNSPKNTSPNNTGLQSLPPAKSAFIWYPYDKSDVFPLVGTGGRNAMAGPVYYADQFSKAPNAFPKYYDGKLFIYEWMRGWIIAVTFDKNGNLKDMEKFMPSYKFSNPMDMAFADNGDLYMLEYGSGWFTKNEDARLIRIEYNKGNRKPDIVLNNNQVGGKVPFTLDLNAKGTSDPDNDKLNYSWLITSNKGYKKKVKGDVGQLVLNKPGVYKVALTVDDKKGGVVSKSHEVIVGNDIPKVSISMTKGNKTFYAPNKMIQYKVSVSDTEDGEIDEGISPDQVSVNFDYLAEGYDKNLISMGHRDADVNAAFAKGKNLIKGSDCMSCHKRDGKSIGPSYIDIADRYKENKEAIEYLSKKIIMGGSKVWGETAMAAHPQLSKEDATEMAKYIMNIRSEEVKKSYPVSGEFATRVPKDDKGKGVFIMRASYEDGGADGLPSLRAEETFILRNSMIGIHDYDQYENVSKLSFAGKDYAIASKDGYIRLNKVDFNGIKEFVLNAIAPKPQVNCSGGFFELRLDSPTGKLLGTSQNINSVNDFTSSSKLVVPINYSSNSLHDLYLVFKNPDPNAGALMVLISTEFILDLPDAASDLGNNSKGVDYFLGKWVTLVKGTPSGDVNGELVIEQGKNGLVGRIKGNDSEMAVDKVEIISPESIKIFFNMNGMPLNMILNRKDEDNASGKLIDMFDVSAKRFKVN